GIGKGEGRHFDELGAAKPQHVLLFLALGVGNEDQGAIAACACDHCKPDAGIAGGGFHHEPAGPEIATLLRFQDHPLAGAVLDGLARIHEFGLAENGAAGQFGSMLEFDQRRIADRLDDVVVELHIAKNTGCFLWPRTLKDQAPDHKQPRRATAIRISRTRPAGHRYSLTEIPPRNRTGSIPTSAGTGRRIPTASGWARPRGNYFARSQASWHNLAQRCA